MYNNTCNKITITSSHTHIYIFGIVFMLMCVRFLPVLVLFFLF